MEFPRRRFWVSGCGGMFGTPEVIQQNPSCGAGEHAFAADSNDDAIAEPPRLRFSCCGRQDGCSAGFRAGLSVALALVALVVAG